MVYNMFISILLGRKWVTWKEVCTPKECDKIFQVVHILPHIGVYICIHKYYTIIYGGYKQYSINPVVATTRVIIVIIISVVVVLWKRMSCARDGDGTQKSRNFNVALSGKHRDQQQTLILY